VRVGIWDIALMGTCREYSMRPYGVEIEKQNKSHLEHIR
jgi:hypothetical protein